MTEIDLVDYTNVKKKIPSTLLDHIPVAKAEISSWKIVTAFFFDFLAISTVTIMVSAFIKISFNSFMVTSSLQYAFEKISFSNLTVNFLPLIFMSYFFFSFFFNQGQSWGMSTMKNRIEMKEMDFRSSLLWAMFSSVVMMTGGISFLFTYNWMQKKKWGSFKEQDHLYTELIQEQFYSPVNLLEMTKTADQSRAMEENEDSYSQAA